eukprot:2472542-Rhodomonas_salina.1
MSGAEEYLGLGPYQSRAAGSGQISNGPTDCLRRWIPGYPSDRVPGYPCITFRISVTISITSREKMQLEKFVGSYQTVGGWHGQKKAP